MLEDILEVNLTTEEVKRYSRPELFERWIGGTGVALQLLKEHVPEDVNPLGPDNAIIFTIGRLSTFYPILSKTVCMFRSPLTGDLGESHAGGRLSLAMRFAGIGALIVKGRAKKSCYITIDDDDVKILRAGPIAYMYPQTLSRVIDEKYPLGAGSRSLICIGPAGENLVTYGNIVVDTYRHFGRLGGGAVMGSKNLKAILIRGKKDLPLDSGTIDRKTYAKTYDKIWDQCVNTEVMRKYHVLGTAGNVLPLNAINGLPTRNFQKGSFEHAEQISGEEFCEVHLGRRVSCNTCPVGCVHLAILRERYGADSPADVHSLTVPYDHEPIYAVGSMLEIPDALQVLRLIEETERLGIDVISAGVILAWMAEAYEQGIITQEDTDGLVIEFGNTKSFVEVMKKLAFRWDKSNEFYKLAGEGLDALVKRYGGVDYAMMLNKHPPAGYSTGPYTIFGHAIGGRHSHLDNAGYSLDQKTMKNDLPPHEAVLSLVLEEEWRNVLNSLIICLFARKLYTPELVVECFQNLGMSYTEEELLELGKEIQKERYLTKIRFGFTFEELFKTIPKRAWEMPNSHGTIRPEKYDELKAAFITIAQERYGISIEPQ